MEKSTNPLAAHFRQPAIHLKLPSNGSYWPDGALELPATGEIPVFPMTTKDEITLRTPDALINGSSMVDVIKSCIPAIIDPWKMPSVDVDACLLAIRIASNGNLMDITTVCPKCEVPSEFQIDLTQVLAERKMPVFGSIKTSTGLIIKLKPQCYFEVNKENQLKFDEARLVAVMTSEISDVEKAAAIDEITKKILEINARNLRGSTEYLELPDGTRITNTDQIEEFYSNSPSSLVKEMQETLKNISLGMRIRPLDAVCPHCEHEFATEVEFDYSNFFGNA